MLIIGMYKFRGHISTCIFRNLNAIDIDIDAKIPRLNIIFSAPFVYGPQVVAAATADLANQYFSAVGRSGDSPKLLEPLEGYCMTSKVGINKIQLPHVPFYVGKRNIITVE